MFDRRLDFGPCRLTGPLALALCHQILILKERPRRIRSLQSSRSPSAEPTQIASFSAVILRTNCLARPGLSQNAPLNWSDVTARLMGSLSPVSFNSGGDASPLSTDRDDGCERAAPHAR
jgi:hypothetical protein